MGARVVRGARSSVDAHARGGSRVSGGGERRAGVGRRGAAAVARKPAGRVLFSGDVRVGRGGASHYESRCAVVRVGRSTWAGDSATSESGISGVRYRGAGGAARAFAAAAAKTGSAAERDAAAE